MPFHLHRIAGLATIVALATVACEQASEETAPPQPTGDNEFVENRGADKDNWWDSLPRPEWQAFPRVSVSSDWFEVYEVEDSIFAIYEPGQFEEVISYLVIGTERALLFDSGLGIGDIRAVVDELTDLDVVVLNSHTHYDHIGGNHQFDSILATDTAYTQQREQGGSPEDVAEFIGPGWVWKSWPRGFDPGAYRSQPFVVERRVDDGDSIDLGNRVLEVLLTPGHAPDSLCLLDRENRLLFTGDTFYLATLYAHLDGSDPARYRASARRLAGLAGDVDHLLTAHNVPVVDGRYLVELDAAFTSILDGRGDYALADGHREYDFGDFSIMVPDRVLE